MIISLLGPTAVGKTALSIALAKHYETEIISGDSVQVYKGLDIGSGKIKDAKMQGIKHHLIDILDPKESFSVANFQRIVRKKIKELETKNKLPLIVGGTGLYIKSVLYDYNFEDTKRDKDKLKKYNNTSNEKLHHILQQKDFEAASTIHPNNRKRVLQAISRSDKNKVSKNKNKDQKLYEFLAIGLKMDRQKLYERINARVDHMIEVGLLKEVRHLYDLGIRSNCVSAIGYKELYKYFDGVWTLDKAVAKIKQHSRNLAKKQMTFFRNQFDISWIDVTDKTDEEITKEAIKLIDQNWRKNNGKSI
ncbi:MAG: tRNA (adenosine(37)-N6)-dimethylallyltransferase MiaA [Candidatus Izimaplasma sp.]|nr:tRNA (adenosine(37)-N6)-dimethylallyltransferase MiaA [Candidatus Izimaplasma bacterium]